MSIDLATLPDDPATLQQMLREVVAAAAQQQAVLQGAVSERDAEIEKLRLLIQRLLRHQFGRRSEKLSPDQLQLGLEDLEQDIAANEAAQGEKASQDGQARSRRRAEAERNHGALPSHLPRYEVLIDVDNRDCPCCGGALHPIGELRSEQLDIVPAQLRVRVTRRPRYACRSCESAVVVAPAPERPIDGGMASEALVVQVVVSKFCDSLPLYRQSKMFERQGINLDRSTLSNWVGRACWWLTPLYELLLNTALSSAKLFADDTTLPVLMGPIAQARWEPRSWPRQDQDRASLVLCGRRPALVRPRPSDCRLRLQRGSQEHPPRPSPRRLPRRASGGRL